MTDLTQTELIRRNLLTAGMAGLAMAVVPGFTEAAETAAPTVVGAARVGASGAEALEHALQAERCMKNILDAAGTTLDSVFCAPDDSRAALAHQITADIRQLSLHVDHLLTALADRPAKTA